MIRKIIILSVVTLCLFSSGTAQERDSLSHPKSHYILSAGTGWSHYINTMELVSTKDVDKDFISVSLLFLWDPGYRVSLGLETGFYRMYVVQGSSDSGLAGRVRTNVFPFFLVARMRIVDHFYLSVAPGIAVMSSKVTGIGDQINTTVWSLANLKGTASYLYPVSKRFVAGGEVSVIVIGKARDYIYSLQAVVAIKL
jgi:hypothetical protein